MTRQSFKKIKRLFYHNYLDLIKTTIKIFEINNIIDKYGYFKAHRKEFTKKW